MPGVPASLWEKSKTKTPFLNRFQRSVLYFFLTFFKKNDTKIMALFLFCRVMRFLAQSKGGKNLQKKELTPAGVTDKSRNDKTTIAACKKCGYALNASIIRRQRVPMCQHCKTIICPHCWQPLSDLSNGVVTCGICQAKSRIRRKLNGDKLASGESVKSIKLVEVPCAYKQVKPQLIRVVEVSLYGGIIKS